MDVLCQSVAAYKPRMDATQHLSRKKLCSATANGVQSSLCEHHTIAAALMSTHVDTRVAHLAAAEVICVVSVVDSCINGGACTAMASVSKVHVDRADNIMISWGTC